MTDLRTAAQQALEALEQSETFVSYEGFGMARREAERKHQAAIAALRVALAESVQEPVAWMTVRLNVPIQTTARKDVADEWLKWGEVLPLYTSPPQRKPLTDEEIDKAYREIWRDLPSDFDHTSSGWIEQGIRYAERAHGIT